MSVATLRVGSDLDGVMYDWGEAMRGYLVKAHGFLRCQLPDSTQWNTWDAWGIPKATFMGYFSDAAKSGDIWRHGEIEPGVVDVLQHCRNSGDSIHIVTHRNHMGANGIASTAWWLEENGVPFDTLTFGADKCAVPVDIFIEDNVDNYRAIEASDAIPVLFTRPWNKAVEGDFRRVSSFAEFGDLVERFRAWRTEFPLLKNFRAKDYL